MTDTRQAKRTYRYDRLKSPFYGILESGWQSFALVIAIRQFEAPEALKAFIAGAGPMGFLLTPATLFLAARLRARPSSACAATFGLSAILLGGAAAAGNLWVFAACSVASMMAAVQQGPLMLQIYAENYPDNSRGSRLATPFILVALASISFSVLGGRMLDADIGHFRWIYAIMLLSALAAAAFVARIPASPLSTEHVGNPWQNFSLVWKDRFFGYVLGSWMVLGIGNLIAMPIRVEYLANPDYGVNANNTTIALLITVVPSATRIVCTKLWGRLFDRLHFVTMRNLLNSCFLVSIGLFFFTTNTVLLAVAMGFQGIAMGGGKIFWSLWVTKIAPREKASSYMTIHMALTGFRGTLAPFLGYWILSRSAPTAVAITSLVLVVVAILLFEGVRGHPRLRRRTDLANTPAAT